jgi:uncharacterized membrane protein
MKPKDFHDKIDQKRLVEAIAAAERETHGRIYVYVSHRAIEDALGQARRRFAKLGLAKLHDHRATVLIYIAPVTHKFAIVGDTGIHERCGDAYWNEIAEGLGKGLKGGDITGALLATVERLKGTLVEHFPKG